MRPQIEIANPLPGGLRKTSIDRASSFVRRGMAYMQNGKLHFTLDNQQQISEQDEFLRNRGGVLFWNGARSYYLNGYDIAMYPPGCNVSFKPPNWIKR